ncbi:YadA-like family protein [Burkholderia stabilis]|uniref:YadA-like family protein n=1 Tax=Burkholderia stabilis TaxID=95485 RepID=UPI002408FACE|nr:YadA-like family protein [Burkholderia stabilis]
MNKTYRTVWNATTGTWVAAAETARGHSKSNSTMKSAVATAVAMMAGVGGVAVSFDADAQAANGAGGLALCGPTGGANGQAFGSGSSMGTALTAACGASSSRLSLNHPMAFQLYNNTASNGSGVGPASAATEVGIGGSKDGHLMLLGGSGVHIQGPADFDNNVNLTNHRINNLAAGTADTDAVNVAQLKAAITASDDPYVSIATGLYATAKPAVTTAGNSGIAIGANASSTGVSAIALGGNTVASAANAMAIGTIANATAAETTAVGVGANATANNATALGRGASATAANSAALGSYSVANRANSVSVGNATTQRQIVNVAAGTQITDAVNLGQMNTELDKKVDKTTTKVGGTVASTASGNASNIAIGSGAASTSGTANSASIALGANASATGAGAIAVGSGSTTSGSGGAAFGVRSNAGGANAVALGTDANATGTNSVALGYGSTADRANAVSVGSSTLRRQITNMAAGTQATDAVNLSQLTPVVTALGGGATINATTGAVTGPTYNLTNGGRQTTVGDALSALDGSITTVNNNLATKVDNRFVKVLGSTDATAAGLNSVAIGNGAITGSGDPGVTNQVAIGSSANAQGLSAVAIGSSAATDGTGAQAVGRFATATGNFATAMGNQSSAQAAGATALGDRASVATGATNSVAIGSQANIGTNVTNSVALGAGSTATRNNTVSVGSSTVKRQITDVAAGTLATDAVNLAQLNAAIASVGPVTSSPYFKANGAGDGSDDAKAVGVGSVAVGSNASTTTDGGVAIGDNAASTMANGVAIGKTAVASLDGVAIGRGADATTTNAIALGAQSSAADNATSLGFNAKSASNAMALGANTVAVGNNSVALGNGSVASAANTVSVGSAGNERKIVNVAAGDLSATSTDAVNGSQLFATNQDIGDLRDSLKDGGVIDPNTGKSLAVVYDDASKKAVTLGGAGAPAVQLKNVADATENNDAVNLGQLKDAGLVAPVDPSNPGAGLESLAVTYGTNADGSANFDSVALKGGTNGTTLSNVAAGKADKDAVNVSQLKDSGLIGGDGKAIAAVTYDRNADGTPNLGSVTLGGAGASTPVALKNVADATENNDAVNLGQLKDAGLVAPVDPSNPGAGLASLAVTYGTKADGSANFDSVALKGGANGTTLSNVAAGVADKDAVNVSQLKGSGLIGDDGKALAAVTYDVNADGTPNYNSVQLGSGKSTGPVALSNVADGKADDDAVNVGQLKTSGLIGEDDKGNLTSLAVAYDDASKGKVTLGGGATGTTITNVKAGDLSATSTDAVNGSQLFATNQDIGDLRDSLKDGGVIDPTTGESLAVVYDGTAKDKVTLAGTTGTTLSNVKAGVADMDAVNVSQLKDSGLIGGDGKAIAAVTYDRNADGTPNYGSVTLGDGNGPVKVSNVADATGDSDALNLGQLKQAGLVGDDGKGNLTSLAVAYDDASKGKVTLGGGATGTTITNVKAGDLSATSTDAVNGSQLFATNQDIGDLRDSLKDGGVIDPTTGESLAVVYDGTAKDKVTLAGTTGTTLSNVKAGVADMDAVNVSQLKGSGLVGDDGKAIAAVTYDRNTDGTPNYGSVTLGSAGASTPVALKNVAAAVDGTDAVNYGQLQKYVADNAGGPGNPLAVAYDDAAKGAITLGGANGTTITNVAAGAVSATSTDAINGSQLHGVSQSVADSLGGGSTVGTDGSVTAPTYSLADPADASKKTDYHSVGDALDNLDGRVVDNTKNITVINNQLADSGLVDPSTGQAIAAVTYDRNTDGTPNYNSVKLGGDKATGPVALSNVADGVARHDAVNLGQLQDAGLVAPVDPSNPGAGLASLAVTYGTNADGSANFDEVALKGGTNGTTIKNVAAGDVSATSKDAINGSQLFATNERVGSLEDSLQSGGVIDPVTRESLAVVYDSAAKDHVTLGGKGATAPVTLSNVAAGTADTDAVNVAQLKDAGLVAPVDPTNPGSGLASLAVTYGKNADGSANFDSVSLKGTAGTTITNVAAGAVSATSTDAINGAQLHGVSQSVADSLGGGSTVGADGTVTNPTYSLADPADASKKQDYHNVGDALDNLDGRVVDNTKNITVINNQLADSGLVDPLTGQSIAAVTYDRNADGTSNYNSVKLGGDKATGPVALKNVADGVDRTDAVNVGQLQDAGLVAPVDPTKPGTLASLAVTYGKNTDGTANFDQVVLAGKSGTTITNVKAGAVNATSTDAVNGAQLHGVSQSVADSLGGGSTVDANGNVTNPTYTVNNQTFNNVGDAITNISNSLADGSIGLVQQDETTRDITVAKDTDGTVVDFTGTAGDRKLTGVAAGTVSATSNDAINGSQLHGTAQSVADVIGGGTTVDVDGKLADTAIQVNGQKYSTVAEAVQAAAAYGATDSLAVRYDLNADGTPNYGSVTLGGTGAAPVILTNVADGVNRNDAVNFGQLSDLSDKFDGLGDRVGALEQNPGNGGGSGGGSGDNPYFSGTDVTPGSSTAANAGTGTGNTAAGSGASVGGGANNATVIGSNASATKDNGAAIGSGAKSTGEGATAIGSNASASGSQSVAIGSGSVANEANTVSFGNADNPDTNRRIVNIADGVNANDAASKGQLDRAVGGLQGQINDVSKNAYSGIAAATALTMIPGVDPGKTLSFGVGGATYKGYQAVAFGGEARITQNLKMKAGVGLSSGGNTVGVGASYQW